MKIKQLFLGTAIIAVGFTSCQDEKTKQAEDTVANYEVYVDSLENVSEEQARANWETIETNYEQKRSDAEMALANLNDQAKAKEKVAASKSKYETIKTKIQQGQAQDRNQVMRNALFGEGKVGEDMSFAWVNASNILGVYQQFVDTVEANKDRYSREDWDEVKMMYEALDSRKNTVEKEGLSSEDNRKIAALKLKFAPMFTVNRIGAKSEEMEHAKK
ncbi:hypothetical protein [Flavobacterium crassostreae]|uniref:hypothetical protein n=1 Tax=Flavobacterium crassostreae TaxID=1763534 RepID=UPI0008A3BE2C|nr:hypothetical protein [Flavobacterium crassostreae]